MERINNTANVSENQNGTGRDGFAEDPAPTELSSRWFNNVQEELANVVEQGGVTLDGDDHLQVWDRVGRSIQDLTRESSSGKDFRAAFVVSGLIYSNAGGLNVSLSSGVFVSNGFKYAIGADKISALGTETPRTLTDNATSWILISPHSTDPRSFTIRVVTGTLAPQPTRGECFLARVMTSGGSITSIRYPHINGAASFTAANPQTNLANPSATSCLDICGAPLTNDADIITSGRSIRRVGVMETVSISPNSSYQFDIWQGAADWLGAFGDMGGNPILISAQVKYMSVRGATMVHRESIRLFSFSAGTITEQTAAADIYSQTVGADVAEMTFSLQANSGGDGIELDCTLGAGAVWTVTCMPTLDFMLPASSF